ncbi:MAG: hydrogenase expression/formation protein HypE [Verrucomicrobia bacterium]|nr:hydrogenase expression/formation protein HypE [Verrucomicrobiota bacterium]
MKPLPEFSISCPLPISDGERILLAHGGGGKMMQQLIATVFRPALDGGNLEVQHDGAVLPLESSRLAFTTDSYVVHPLFFPGGNIGTLAIYGTVNDLAMCGAVPLYLSAGFILEEGTEMDVLRRVVESMRQAADACSVQLVTGDTKVVDKGKGDGIFITTAGIGVVKHSLKIHPKSIRAGDKILLNGDLGRHGIAIMAQREGLAFEGAIESDAAPLSEPVQKLLNAGIRIHCLRDLTRGGLASALNEIVSVSGLDIHVREKTIPVCEPVKGACEILGLDPLYVANEGRFITIVPAEDADRALSVLRTHPLGREASLIGEVKPASTGWVTMTNAIGTNRILDLLSGEQLPRIC